MAYPPELQKEIKRVIDSHGGIDRTLQDWLTPGAMTVEDSQVIVDAWGYITGHHRPMREPNRFLVRKR